VKLLAPLTFVCCLFGGSPAGADLITFNSSSFAVGVDVSEALDGITLQRLSQGGPSGPRTYAPTITPVLTSTGWYGPSQTLFSGGSLGYDAYHYCSTLGRNPEYQGFSCLNGYSVLELNFDAPTNFVSLVGYFGMDAPGMIAYASDGTLLGGCGTTGAGISPGCLQTFAYLGTTPPFGDYRSTLSITSSSHDISRIVWGSFAGASFLGAITYNVPEPGTLLLSAIGLAGFFIARSRRGNAGTM
jgi:hypothetical protein